MVTFILWSIHSFVFLCLFATQTKDKKNKDPYISLSAIVLGGPIAWIFYTLFVVNLLLKKEEL